MRVLAFDTATRAHRGGTLRPRGRRAAESRGVRRAAGRPAGGFASGARRGAARAGRGGDGGRGRRLGGPRPARRGRRTRHVHRAADRDRDRARACSGQANPARRGLDARVAGARRCAGGVGGQRRGGHRRPPRRGVRSRLARRSRAAGAARRAGRSHRSRSRRRSSRQSSPASARPCWRWTGRSEFRSALERSGAVIPEDGAEVHRVVATCHCELASEQRPGRPEDVTPSYLRSRTPRSPAAGADPTHRPPMTTEPATRIRSLRYSDLPQVIAIERRAYRRPGRSRCSCSSSPSRRDLPAAPRGRAARRIPRLRALRRGVAPDEHRRRPRPPAPGRRRALLREIIERAGAETPFTLEVRVSNAGAIALYERFGFRAAGTRPATTTTPGRTR